MTKTQKYSLYIACSALTLAIAIVAVSSRHNGLLISADKNPELPAHQATPPTIEHPSRPDEQPIVTKSIDPQLSSTTSELPALEEDLSSFIDDLKARSDSGESSATCRLAAEYDFCARQSVLLVENDRWLSSRQLALEMNSDPEARKLAEANIERQMRSREDRVSKIASHCAGVELSDPISNAKRWLKSAQQGSLEAKKHYASGNTFRWNDILEVLPLLEDYKRNAEAMAFDVAKSGDPEMILALALAYSPLKTGREALLSQAVVPDPAKAVALYRLVLPSLVPVESSALDGGEREVRRVMAELQLSLSAADASRSEALYQEFVGTWGRIRSFTRDDNRDPVEGRVYSGGRGQCFESQPQLDTER